MSNSTTFKPGDMVVVGPRFTMDHGYVADEYAGQTFMVLEVRKSSFSGCISAGLALPGSNEEHVDIAVRRLTHATVGTRP